MHSPAPGVTIVAVILTLRHERKLSAEAAESARAALQQERELAAEAELRNECKQLSAVGWDVRAGIFGPADDEGLVRMSWAQNVERLAQSMATVEPHFSTLLHASIQRSNGLLTMLATLPYDGAHAALFSTQASVSATIKLLDKRVAWPKYFTTIHVSRRDEILDLINRGDYLERI